MRRPDHGILASASAGAVTLALLLAAPAQAVDVVPFGSGIFDVASAAPPATPGSPPQTTTTAATASAVSFEPNRGQTSREVRFLARGARHALFLTASEAVLRTRSRAGGAASVLRMRFTGADPAVAVTGEQRLPGVANYLVGSDRSRWRSGLPRLGRVRYHDLWPGIDTLFYGDERRLEYDFIVSPGSSPSAIGLSLSGARSLRLSQEGDLLIGVAGGLIRQLRPVAYQVIDGKRRPVTSRYVLARDGHVGFRVGGYDRRRTLVIDPVIVYSTLLGAAGADTAIDIAVDAAGNAYVTGDTESPAFPHASPYDNTLGGVQDAFITKYSPSGGQLLYSTYLGGGGSDGASAIAVDAQGNAYVAGSTSSTDFPLAGALQSQPGGGPDAFVTKLNPTGTALVYSTYLGGAGNDGVRAIALHSGGIATVSGQTTSANFPRVNAFQAQRAGARDAFLTKIVPNGSALAYSTFLGGGDNESANAIAVSSAGEAHLAGSTRSVDFPVANAFEPAQQGNVDGFVTAVNAAGSALKYSTYLGGAGLDDATDIAIDATGGAYLTGFTFSADFPRANAFQPTLAGSSDVHVTKLTPAGDMAYASFLGGGNFDLGFAIAVDAEGSAYAAGETFSADYPRVAALQSTYNGPSDAYVTKIEAADTTPPATLLMFGPTDPSSNSVPSFTFLSSPAEPGVRYECALDAPGLLAFAPCVSPKAYPSLPDGTYTFRVRAIDSYNNEDPTPEVWTWRIDTAPPKTTIISAPAAATNATSVTISFAANETATFRCRLDAGTALPCTSPHSYAGLADGAHSVEVRATDAADNIELSPPVASWKIDRTPPAAFALNSPVDGADNLPARPQFSWSPTVDAETSVARYELRVDGVLQATVAHGACASTCTATASMALTGGDHSWRVIAIDAAANERPTAPRTFGVDAQPPALTLAAPQHGAFTSSRRPQLSWTTATDTGSGIAGYEIRIDGVAAGEAGPGATTFMPGADLAEGPHAWLVVARDIVGNTIATQQRTFTIDTTAPVAAITAAPTAALAGSTVVLDAGGSSDGGGIARFDWDLDGDDAFETDTAASAITTRAFPDPGVYAVQVRVTDHVGQSATARADVRITPRPSAPAPYGITINNAAAYTRSPRVTIRSTWPSFATSMLISNDGGFGLPRTSGLARDTEWTLDESGAERSHRVVYVRFQRGLTTSETYTDDIILDQLAPIISSARLVPRAGRTPARIRMRARDVGLAGVSRIQMTNNRRRPGTSFRAYRTTLTLPAGTRTLNPRKPVFVRVRDKAGNTSAWRAASRAPRR